MTNLKFENREKVVRLVSAIGVASLPVAGFLFILTFGWEIRSLYNLYLFALLAFVVPFLLLHLALFSAWHNFSFRRMGVYSLPLVLIILPFAYVWAFSIVNKWFGFLPGFNPFNLGDLYSVTPIVLFLYFSLSFVGLLIRLKKKKKKLANRLKVEIR